MLWLTSKKSFFMGLLLSLCLAQAAARAQSASTGVDVGPGRAGAWGSASGQFQHVDTNSRVGPNGSLARGLAIGAGPNGLAISHSIGVHGGGAGAAHNFNMTIGPGGTHVSGGAVNAFGGSSGVQSSGQANAGRWGLAPSGGSSVGGFGRHVDARTHARTDSFGPASFQAAPFGPPAFGPAFAPSPFSGRGPAGFPGRGPFQRGRW